MTDRDLIAEARRHTERDTAPRWMAEHLPALLDRFAAVLSELDTATMARQIAEARADAINASHASRDAVRLLIAALLGMRGEPPPAAIAARVREIMDAVRAALATAPIAWPELDALRALIGGR